MNVIKLIEHLPTSVKLDLIDFDSVELVINGKNRQAIRVLCGHVLTDEEKDGLKNNKHILGINSIAQYRYAPEIKHSYFYVV